MRDRLSSTHLVQGLIQNSALIVAARVVAAVVSLVSVPIIVARLGISGYGTWEAVLAVTSLSEAFLGTLRFTLLWRMSAAFGRRDGGEMKHLVGVGMTATLALFLLVVPAVWLLRYPLVRVLQVPSDLADAVAWILPVLGGLMALRGISETLGSAVGGAQRTGSITMIETGGLVVNYFFVVGGILVGWGIWSLLIGYAIGLVVNGIFLYGAAVSACGALSLAPALPRRDDLKALSRYSGLMFAGYVSAALRDQTDKLVLATLASPTWVGYYGIASRLATLVLEINRYLSAPLLTAVGALHAMGDWPAIRRLYANTATIVSLGAGFVSVVLLSLYDRVLVLWMGRAIPEVKPFLLLLVAGNLVAVLLTGPGSSVCRGMGRMGVETAFTVFSLIVNLLLTITLVLWIGPFGTVIASSVTSVLASLLFAVLLHRALDLPAGATWRSGLTIVVVLAAGLIVRLVAERFPVTPSRIDALASVAGLGCFCFLVYAVLMFGLRIVALRTVRTAGQRFYGALQRTP